jgi:hypothetical protein
VTVETLVTVLCGLFLTTVTAVTTLGRGRGPTVDTHVYVSPDPISMSPRGCHCMLVTAVTVVTIRTLCDPTSEVRIEQDPVVKRDKGYWQAHW